MKLTIKDLPVMDQRAYRNGPRLGKTTLDILMPMHLWVGPTGHIIRAGPTLQKLLPDQQIQGQRLTELLEFRRPKVLRTTADLLASDGRRVQAMFRIPPRTLLKGLVVPFPKGQGFLLNLSLGIAVADTVRRYSLTGNDFAASDPTVEMLYLIEAQALILGESKNLNSRLQGAKIAAEEQAFTDTLTGLKNRRALDHLMTRLITAKGPARFGLMHLDLDFFKAVNDTHGHAAGDHVLQKAAQIFVEETRRDDIVARIGGDEFVLILVDCDDLKRLNKVASRIIARLEEPIHFDGNICRISASIGTTVSTFYTELEADRLSNDADTALYASKNRGRACHTVFEEGLQMN